MSAQAHQTLERIIEAQRLQDYPNLESDKYFERFLLPIKYLNTAGSMWILMKSSPESSRDKTMAE